MGALDFLNPISGVISAGASIAGAVKGGGSSSSAGYTLPPEYEIQFLQQMQQQLGQMHADYQQYGQAYQAYNNKLNVLNNIISGGPKQDSLRALQESNYSLGMSLGGNAAELAKNGFLTKQDQADFDKMKSLVESHGQGYQNPALEGQLASQKRQLDQQLASQGVPAAQRAIALAQFDQSANEQRYAGAQQQFGMMGSLLQQQAGIRQQGYSQVSGTYGQNQGMANNMFGALNANYGAQYGGLQQMLQGQAQLRGEQQGAYTTLGSFKLSNNTKNLIAGGIGQQWGGPGNMMQQTGISSRDARPFKNYIQDAEMGYARGKNPLPNYTPAGFYANQQGNHPSKFISMTESPVGGLY